MNIDTENCKYRNRESAVNGKSALVLNYPWLWLAAKLHCQYIIIIKKNTKITICNFLNRYRYSELWALLFSKLKKPVNLTENLTVCEFRVSLESPHRRKVQRILESAIIFLVFIFGRSYWFNKSFIDANYKVLKVLFFCYLYSCPVF